MRGHPERKDVDELARGGRVMDVVAIPEDRLRSRRTTRWPIMSSAAFYDPDVARRVDSA